MKQELKEQLDLFFEIEKRDNLEEFKINFSNFIEMIDNKEGSIYYLLKLFLEEQQVLIKDTKSTPLEFEIGHKINLDKIKKVIYYLKECLKKEKNKKKFPIKKNRATKITSSQEKKFCFPISDKQLQVLGKNIYDLILRIKKNQFEIGEDLETILTVCNEEMNLKKDRVLGLVKEKNSLKEITQEQMDDYDRKIEILNVHMDILNNLINYLKHYYRNRLHRNYNIAVSFKEDLILSDKQQYIKDNLFNIDLNHYDESDILLAFSSYLKYDSLENKKEILSFVKKVFNQLENKKIEENVETSIYYILDAIKYRRLNEEKKNFETKELLKDIRDIFKGILKNVEKEKLKKDPLFDIANYFIISENGYLYLKKLIAEIPEIVNARHIVIEENEKHLEHIVIYIVKEFLNNYRKMLMKSKTYINKDYLKAIYFLFTKNHYLYLTKVEMEKIDQLLKDFLNDTAFLTSSRRKNAVKEDIRKMYTSNFYHLENYNREVNEGRLENQMNAVGLYVDGYVNKNRHDLIQERTVQFLNPYDAYSIEIVDGITRLKIHVIDLYPYIPNYTTLNDYIYNCTIGQEEIDPFLIRRLSMKVGNIYPTITYEIEFNEKGNFNIDNFSLYKSVIKIDRKINQGDFYYNKDDKDINSYLALYKRAFIKNGGDYSKFKNLLDIESYFENICNQGILELFRKNQFPILYSGIESIDKKEMMTIMNSLSSILSSLKRENFLKICSVLHNEVSEFHYSLQEFKNPSVYEFYIVNPVNYIGLSIQRIIHECLLDCFSKEDTLKSIERYTRELEELTVLLNYSIGYVDLDTLKYNKGKISKTKRILF